MSQIMEIEGNNVAEINDPEAPSVENTTNLQNSSDNDPYAYLNRDEFSSEKFKIIVKNLPKYYGVNELRKLVNDKLKLASNKIKFPKKNSPFVFVCFRNEEDRKNAITTISDFKWKGKLLVAGEAKPAPDPLVKRRNEQVDNDLPNKKVKTDDRPQSERLKSSTIPLWNVPYPEQLKSKQDDIKQILLKLGRILARDNPVLKKWFVSQKYGELPYELLSIRHASEPNGYRNKCEFTVGIDEETSLPTVGFRIGSYAKGGTGVAPVKDLEHIPDAMKVAVKVFQDFVRASDLQVFNPEFQTGHFRQLTVRSALKQLMLIVGIHPQDLSEEKLRKFKDDLKEYFFEGNGKEAEVTSLYYQTVVKKVSNEDVNLAEHLGGTTHIQESILGLNFRISPEAFFQINTAGAEILYSSAIEMAQPVENTTVVDICCGTGTIGLCFAKSCNQVLGIEIIPQAVEDAKENARTNDIENCEFFAGKAEEILSSVLYRAKNEDVVAIVDPPRAGLHQKCIMQLRNSSKINKLIYVSCNPNAAMKNFIDLGRSISKVMHGEPFVPVKAVPVDMFPHTKHCELVIYFERYDKEKFESRTTNSS